MGSGTGGRQQIRPKAGMALASTPLGKMAGDSKNSGGAMTNSREATKMAQKLAMDLQEVGIQCVEALVEWMLEAGAKAECVCLTKCYLVLFGVNLTVLTSPGNRPHSCGEDATIS